MAFDHPAVVCAFRWVVSGHAEMLADSISLIDAAFRSDARKNCRPQIPPPSARSCCDAGQRRRFRICLKPRFIPDRRNRNPPSVPVHPTTCAGRLSRTHSAGTRRLGRPRLLSQTTLRRDSATVSTDPRLSGWLIMLQVMRVVWSNISVPGRFRFAAFASDRAGGGPG